MDTPEPKEPGDPSASVGGGSPWARWDYTPEEWQLFDQRDWESAVRMFVRSMWGVVRFYLILAVGGVLLLMILTIAGFVPPVSPLLFGVEVLGVAAAMLVVIPIFAMTDMLQLLNAWKRHLARRKEPRHVIIGSLASSGNQAIWVGEQYVLLQSSLLRLYQASLYEGISHETNMQRYQPELNFSRRLGPLNLVHSQER